MRFIYFLLITFVFTACGHHKIRFSKVKKEQKVVEISEIPSLKKKSETAFLSTQKEEETRLENALTSSELRESDISREENVIPVVEEVFPPKTVEDSTTLTAEEIHAITEEALRSEKMGVRSFTTSILSPILFLLAVLAAFFFFGPFNPVAIVISIALGLASFVCLILSIVFGAISLRSQYGTPRGRKFAIAGTIISSVFLSLFLANILFGIL
jgi:hypothetical protein